MIFLIDTTPGTLAGADAWSSYIERHPEKNAAKAPDRIIYLQDDSSEHRQMLQNLKIFRYYLQDGSYSGTSLAEHILPPTMNTRCSRQSLTSVKPKRTGSTGTVCGRKPQYRTASVKMQRNF